MIRRSSRVLVEVLLGILAVLAVAAAGVGWRLSQGPVSLAFVVPYVDERLAATGSAVDVDLKDIVLTWAGWDRALDIRVLGVTARDNTGVLIAALPEISASFAFVPLLRGEIRPTRLELIKPSIRAHRTETGELEVTLGTDAGATRETFPLLLEALLHRPNPDSVLAELDRVSVVDGDLTVTDDMLSTVWKAPEIDAVLARHDDGLTGRFDWELELEGQKPKFGGRVNYEAAKGNIVLDGAVSGLRLDRLADTFDALAPLAGIALPVDGNFNVELTEQGLPRAGKFRVTAGPGKLAFPDLIGRALPIRSATADGSFDVASGRLRLNQGRIDLEGPIVTFSAEAVRKNGTDAIRIEPALRKLPLEDFKKYWPKTGNQSIRAWIVENMSGGEIALAEGRLALRSTIAGGWSFDFEKARMRIEGTTVHYFKPLVPVKGVAASIDVNPGRVDISVDGGDLNGLEANPVKLTFADDGADNWNLDLVAELRGKLRNALEVLDHPRLGYASGLGLDREHAFGETAIRLRVGFPLLADLKLDQVDIRAAAQLVDVAIPGGLFGRDVRDGHLTLQLDRSGMKVSGTATLANVPASLEWFESFETDSPIMRQYNVKATLGDEARARLGIDATPYLSGPVAADIVLTRRADARSSLTGQFDLRQATVSLAPLGWSKPPSMPGSARIDLDLADDRLVAIRRFEVDAQELAARVSAAFKPDGKTIELVDIGRFSLGARTAFTGRVARREDGGLDVSLSAPAIDGAALLKAHKQNVGASTGLPPIRLAANIDRLWVSADAKLDGANVKAEFDGSAWRLFTAKGGLTPSSSFDAAYRRSGDAQSVRVRSNDAGEMLGRLGLTGVISGGRLSLDASHAGPDDAMPWRGQATISDFRVSRAPILARLLTVASLTGIANLATSKGIAFSRLDLPFELSSDRLQIQNARAIGSQLGISGDGEIDLKNDALKLDGLVVPAYTLNSLIEKIPILGKILTGGEGGGIFAVDYKLSGPLDDPKIEVNPLASLAPGVLRNLVRGISNLEPDPDQSPRPEPPE